MSPENAKKLEEAFPMLYSTDFYFEIKDGWADIIWELSETITSILEKLTEEDPDDGRDRFEVAQVKEKFGGLRYYVYGWACDGSDAIFEAIKKAEMHSIETCEICGKSGKTRTSRHWIETLCDEHETEAKFRDLAYKWEQATVLLSSMTEIVCHPAYQEIISMGKEAIPLILKKLQKQPGYWFEALRCITGENPVSVEAQGDIELLTKAWLDWGKDQGYIE